MRRNQLGFIPFIGRLTTSREGELKGKLRKCIEWVDTEPHCALSVKFSFNRMAFATLYTDVWISFSSAENFSVVYLVSDSLWYMNHKLSDFFSQANKGLIVFSALNVVPFGQRTLYVAKFEMQKTGS